MSAHSTDGLSPAAKALADRVMPLVQQQLHEIQKVPIAVLIWGPNPTDTSPLAEKRRGLRTLLRGEGHWACFSEELVDPALPINPRIQQICQADHFDLVVSLPGAPGSIAEIHDFVRDQTLMNKITVFVNEDFDHGYSNQSLRGSGGTNAYRVITYKTTDLHDSCGLIEQTVQLDVQALRYRKFFSERGRSI